MIKCQKNMSKSGRLRVQARKVFLEIVPSNIEWDLTWRIIPLRFGG